MREDPQIAADLAAAFTKSNGDYLQTRFGRMPSAGELYIAHFLGAQGAERMFTAGLKDPDQIAANLFPQQASANRAIFYSNGEPRTIRDVYRVLVSRHDAGDTNANFAAQQLVGGGPVAAAPPLPSRFSPANMSFTGLFKNEADDLPSTATDAGDGGAFFTQLYSR